MTSLAPLILASAIVAAARAQVSPMDVPYVRKFNVAVKRPVYSSSREFERIFAGPEKANDGDTNPNPRNMTAGCFQAKSTDMAPFWLVDLERMVEVSSVRITNRNDCCAGFLTEFGITVYEEDPRVNAVGMSTCLDLTLDEMALGETKEFNCQNVAPGRWVEIKKVGQVLNLCEVEVLRKEEEFSANAIACTFEEQEDFFKGCGFFNAESQDGRWERVNGSTPAVGTGPQGDHTFFDGNYVYMPGTSLDLGQKASLVSRVITGQAGPRCLTFWYHMHGGQVRDLIVNLYDDRLMNKITEWSMDYSGFDVWRKAQLPFNVLDNYPPLRVVFVANSYAGATHGDIALDDIVVSTESCPFIDQGGRYNIDCDFNDPSGKICDWGQSWTDLFDYVWTDKPDLGTGSYMTAMSTDTGEPEVTLISPLYLPSFPKSCLRFKYRFSGVDGDQVVVRVRKMLDFNQPGEEQSRLNYQASDGWLQAEMDIDTSEPLRIELVAVTRSGQQIAIDDVTLVNKECRTVASFVCPFNHPTDMCGFVQSNRDNFDFGLRKTYTPTLAGAQRDHTSGTGYYLYAKVDEGTLGPGAQGSLFSPTIENQAPYSCLVFYYMLQGATPQGSLVVMTSDPDLTKANTVWSIANGYGVTNVPRDPWTRAAVNIDTRQPIRITFWHNITGVDASLSLDDVSLTHGLCEYDQGVTDTFQCDMNSEVCGLGQMSLSDEYDWLWTRGASLPLGDGPSTDHTFRNQSGGYMYVESDSHHASNDKAILFTPVITPTFAKSCLTFAFHMAGPDMGSLDVFIGGANEHWYLATKVWSRTGEQGNDWKLAQIDLNTRQGYKIYFLAKTEAGKKMDIAIDDINIDILECKTSWVNRVKCNFNNDCSFLQPVKDTFDWLPSIGPVPPQFNGGPLRDRSSANGVYMYLKTDSPRKPGDVAVLATPVVNMPLPRSCLSFWFHMHQAADGAPTGQLAVVLTDPELAQPQTVWLAARGQGPGWRRVELTVNTPNPLRVVFKGTVGTPGKSNIAIDDVHLSKGQCIFDRQVKHLKCDFEKPELCGFGQRSDDEFDWVWHAGSSPGYPTTGPPGDRLNPQTGHYMLLESSRPQSDGESAVLMTPKLQAAAPKNCLTFWYHMNGRSVKSLRVLAQVAPTKKFQIWAKPGNQGPGWKPASVELDASPLPYHLLFEGTVGNGGEGDIAIDDVELQQKPCPGDAKVNCAFEAGSMCGYTQTATDGDFRWSQRLGASQGGPAGGPPGDHTTGRGEFLYVGPYLPRSLMVSPVLDWSPHQGCLKFSYRLDGAGPGGMARLNVFQVPAGQLQERFPVFSRNVSGQNADWTPVQIIMNVMHPIQIVYEAVVGPATSNQVAMDSIRMEAGGCYHPVDCDFTYDQCAWEGASAPVERRRGPDFNNLDRPQLDHTDRKGHYLAVDGPTTGIVRSGSIQWATAANCLSFWYHYGTRIKALRVFAADASDYSLGRQELWDLGAAGDKMPGWHNVEAAFAALADVRIYFEGEGFDLDDISVRPGKSCTEPAPRPEKSTVDCSFDSDMCSHENLATDDSDWALATDANTGEQHVTVGKLLTGQSKAGIALESPVLQGAPSHACVRFWYHMQDANPGVLRFMVADAKSGSMAVQQEFNAAQGQGWHRAELDFDLIKPVKLHFMAQRSIVSNQQVQQLSADIALDDVSVVMETCKPVPWSRDWNFRCDRDTTRCNTGLGTCNPATNKCDCMSGSVGLQCTGVRAQCPTKDKCVRGECYNKGFDVLCACPDGFYGKKCEHEMAQAECSHDRMVLNVLPYGYTDVAFKDIQSPETSSTSCPLVPMSKFVKDAPQYAQRGWQGYAKEFLHTSDPCGGSATAVERTEAGTRYQRTLHVFYNPLGRDVMDTIVNVSCLAPKFPPAKISMKLVEIGSSKFSYVPSGATATPFYVEFQYSVNTPNSANMDELKVEKCTASQDGKETLVVDNGCPIHPVGVMLFDGVQPGTEFLMLRVLKHQNRPLGLTLNCSIRLCDTSTNNFSCFQMAQCFRRRRRRSSPAVKASRSSLASKYKTVVTEVTDLGKPSEKGTRLVDVTFHLP